MVTRATTPRSLLDERRRKVQRPPVPVAGPQPGPVPPWEPNTYPVLPTGTPPPSVPGGGSQTPVPLTLPAGGGFPDLGSTGGTDLGNTGILTSGPPMQPASAPAPAPMPPPVPIPGGTLSPFTATDNLRGQQIAPTFDRGPIAAENNAPTRTDLASQAFDLFTEQQAPREAEGIRRIGQNAAKFGRIGAGMTTTRLGDLGTEMAREREQAKRGLAIETGGLQFGDDMALRNEARGERGYLDARDAAGRGEFRTERGWQDYLAQDAQQDAIRRLTLEDALLNSQYGREMGVANLAGSLGYGQNPANMYLNSANAASANAGAASGAGMDLISALIASGAFGGGGGGGGGGQQMPYFPPGWSGVFG